jgi:GIY-YIG catalytic domain
MIHFIYRWKEPRSPDEILCTKYVGMTNNPNMRMIQHLLCDGKNQDKDAWIKELSAMELEPLFEIIEVVYEGKAYAREREKYWIQYYLDQGCQLTNIRSRKKAVAKSNQTPEQPASIEDSLTDKPLSLDIGFARHAKFLQGLYRVAQPTTKEFKIMLNLYFDIASEGEWDMGEEEWYQNKLTELEETGRLEVVDVTLLNRDVVLLEGIHAQRDSREWPSNQGRPSPLRYG